MYAKVMSASIKGLEGYVVTVEVDLGIGLPYFEIVGLPNALVRESKARVRAAIRNSGFTFPLGRIVVNLAPADVKKENAGLDLAIAIAILVASHQISESVVKDRIFIGELTLEGHIRAVNGVLAMVLAREISESRVWRTCFVPSANGEEAALSGVHTVCAVDSLQEVVKAISESAFEREKRIDKSDFYIPSTPIGDMAEVQGQILAKRALEIAAAGGHNVLLSGPPGAGKTMLAKRMIGIMPALERSEMLEVTALYSVAGLLPSSGLVNIRPFRSPHHTISVKAMVGGGSNPKPGEISLSHRGVLFLDELPEFSRSVLETLRQPMEEGVVSISRVYGATVFPSRPLILAAMNPCPCGFLGVEGQRCQCTDSEIRRYRRKLSGPLLNRMDIFVQMPRVSYKELSETTVGESSASIQKRVIAAREFAKKRHLQYGVVQNSDIGHGDILEACMLRQEGKNLLERCYTQQHWSARTYDRVLRVARTIGDLYEMERVEVPHLIEAMAYRFPSFEEEDYDGGR